MQRFKDILGFGAILLIVFMSKTVYFGMMNKNVTNILFFVMSLVLVVVYKEVARKNIYIVCILFLLLGISIVMNFNTIDEGFVLNIRGIVIVLVQVLLITSCITKKKFIIHYVNIIYVYSIVSIICYAIAIYVQQYVEILSKDVFVGTIQFKVSPFYTWGLDGIFKRNAGPFWEPGAFQGFINIAMLLIVFHVDNINNAKRKIIIFIITLLTTQSTTAYIVFLMIIVIFGFDIVRKFKINMILRCFLLVMIICSGIFIISSNNINNKLEESNQSNVVRTSDYKQSIMMIKERPIGGYGAGNAKNIRELELNIFNNSNGLFSMFYTYGIIFSLYYVYRLIKGINNIFPTSNSFKKISVIIIFIILYCTEGLNWLPFYLTFLFEWKSETQEIE